jgi:hypothetical protein
LANNKKVIFWIECCNADCDYTNSHSAGGDHSSKLPWPAHDTDYKNLVKQRKTLNNSDVNGAKKNIPDLKVFGNSGTFLLICKASSEAEDWMKSTKAMPIPGLGCVVQVTTDVGGIIAEALTYVFGACIFERKNDEGVVVERCLGRRGAGATGHVLSWDQRQVG